MKTALVRNEKILLDRTKAEILRKSKGRQGVGACLMQSWRDLLMNNKSTSRLKEFERAAAELRSPKRISITIPYHAYKNLIDRSDREGRSLSNLAAFLLEAALTGQKQA